VGKRFAKAACKLIDPAIRMDDAVFAEAFFDKAEDIESHAALGKPMRASVPPARGDLQSLTDGTFGSQDLKDKAWVGFAPTEELIEIVLDLGAVMQVELAGVNVLFSPASKAEFPGNLTISTSEDGNDYAVNGSRYNHIKLDKYGREPLLEAKASATPLLVITEQKHRKAPDGIQARYVKISFETGTNWVYFDEFVVNPSRTQTDQSMAADKPIKVFLLAGDDHVLENGLIGSDDDDPGKAGTLTQVVSANPKYAFLKDGRKWAFREDVWRYDAHPIQNNTEAPATPVTVGTGIRGSGPEKAPAIGVDLMLSHRLGAALDEPVLLIRYGLRHRTWFKFGSRDLAHDYRPPSSGGGSDLEGSWDVIHFNFGVWDAVYRESNSRFYKGRHITAVEDFEKNLRTLVGKMQATGATLIWGSVTPVWEGEPGLPNADEDAYNRVAEKVMREHGIIISDLNAESRRLGFPKTDNVHSVGSLAPKVTEEIRKALAARRHPTKPLPRVLFIGDSITGSYWPSAKRELDGEAVVFKNPGNAEDTWNGLERMDEWLDLGGYLLNGQEYLELVDGVRKVLGDELERALPGYAGQGVELAGIFWMQGDEDSRWPSKAAAYETHLANLIRDLRKDFGKPGLPVVVTALGDSKRGLNPNPQQVFDAQMAVGDSQKYPAFAGNVFSVDTRPMCRPQKASPGGRDRFAGNAASYLEIGDAMAQAMLKLLGRKD